jgi:hypothetical protein
MERCRGEEPPFVQIASGRWTACFLYEPSQDWQRTCSSSPTI